MVYFDSRRAKKKLEGAVRHWLTSGVKDESANDLKAFGAPPEVIAAKEAELNAPYEVFEENWPVVEMFLRLQTQWNVAPMGGILGLNYQSVEFAFRIYKIDDEKKIFEGLQVMEAEAKRAMNEERAKNGN